MRYMEKTQSRLLEALTRTPVVDAHEHLTPEHSRLQQDIDIFWFLQWPYVATDLVSAGLPVQSRNYGYPGVNCGIGKSGLSIEEKWKRVAPYIDEVRHGSYYRAITESTNELYGIDEINEKTCHDLSERIKADNKKGIYRKILRDTCNIKAVLNNGCM